MCRHRGVKLTAEPCGGRALFTCLFHAWSYDATGRHVATPHRQSFGNVTGDVHGLVESPLVERHGVLWVKLPPGAPDIDAWLGDLAPEIAALRLGAGAAPLSPRITRTHPRHRPRSVPVCLEAKTL